MLYAGIFIIFVLYILTYQNSRGFAENRHFRKILIIIFLQKILESHENIYDIFSCLKAAACATCTLEIHSTQNAIERTNKSLIWLHDSSLTKLFVFLASYCTMRSIKSWRRKQKKKKNKRKKSYNNGAKHFKRTRMRTRSVFFLSKTKFMRIIIVW